MEKRKKQFKPKTKIYSGPERSRALQLKKTPAKANKTEGQLNKAQQECFWGNVNVTETTT